MDPALLAGILGGIGGATRGVVGILKAISVKRKIRGSYLLATIAGAIIIGIFTGIIFNYDTKTSLLAGYAGTDLLEGVYKTFKTENAMVARK